jgi:hypothetical protein
MIEAIILNLTITIPLLVYIAWKEKTHVQKTNKLVNALTSKNASELRDLTLADNVNIKSEKPREPDLIPTEQLTDEEYIEAVTK